MSFIPCPECGGDLPFTGGSRTLMANVPSFDDQGKSHSHSANTSTSVATCWKGHTYTSKRRDRCPQPDCEWNDNLRTLTRRNDEPRPTLPPDGTIFLTSPEEETP